MHHSFPTIKTASLAMFVFAGCATVNPHPDFDRASSSIERATGQVLPELNDDAAQREAIIAELLANGLTVDEAVKVALLNNTDRKSVV